MKQFADRIEQAEVRLDTLFSVSFIPDVHSLPDSLLALEEEFEQIVDNTGIVLPNYVDLESDLIEDVVDALCRREYFGIFARFSQPVYRKSGKDSVQGSWGNYRQKWFYADTLEQVVEAALQWGEANIKMVMDSPVPGKATT